MRIPIKFPEMEYFHILKDSLVIYEVPTEKVKGKTKTQIELMIGQELKTNGMFYFKAADSKGKNYQGRIRSTYTKGNAIEIKKDSSMETKIILDNIKALEDNIKTLQGGESDKITKMIEKLHQMEIDSLNRKIEELKEDLQNAEEEVKYFKEEANSVNVWNRIPEILSMVNNFKSGKSKVTLSDFQNNFESNPGNIPNEITEIIGAVDWEAVPLETRSQIIQGLVNFISQLPLLNKESNHG
jgi:hypothetical protein